jgi:hypothetical protein
MLVQVFFIFDKKMDIFLCSEKNNPADYEQNYPLLLSSQNICVTISCFDIFSESLAFGSLGVNVMITIFGDFWQFWTKNWRFIKIQCCVQIFTKTSSSLRKTPIFLP